MAFLAECLGAKDRDTWRVLSLNNVGASSRDYFLSESRRIEFVQHDWLTVHSVALVWSLLHSATIKIPLVTYILAKVEREMLALPLRVARHQPLGHVNRSVSFTHTRLAEQRVNASTSVNGLVWFEVNLRLVAELVNRGLLTRLHDCRCVVG